MNHAKGLQMGRVIVDGHLGLLLKRNQWNEGSRQRTMSIVLGLGARSYFTSEPKTTACFCLRCIRKSGQVSRTLMGGVWRCGSQVRAVGGDYCALYEEEGPSAIRNQTAVSFIRDVVMILVRGGYCPTNPNYYRFSQSCQPIVSLPGVGILFG